MAYQTFLLSWAGDNSANGEKTYVVDATGVSLKTEEAYFSSGYYEDGSRKSYYTYGYGGLSEGSSVSFYNGAGGTFQVDHFYNGTEWVVSIAETQKDSASGQTITQTTASAWIAQKTFDYYTTLGSYIDYAFRETFQTTLSSTLYFFEGGTGDLISGTTTYKQVLSSQTEKTINSVPTVYQSTEPRLYRFAPWAGKSFTYAIVPQDDKYGLNIATFKSDENGSHISNYNSIVNSEFITFSAKNETVTNKIQQTLVDYQTTYTHGRVTAIQYQSITVTQTRLSFNYLNANEDDDFIKVNFITATTTAEYTKKSYVTDAQETIVGYSAENLGSSNFVGFYTFSCPTTMVTTDLLSIYQSYYTYTESTQVPRAIATTTQVVVPIGGDFGTDGDTTVNAVGAPVHTFLSSFFNITNQPASLEYVADLSLSLNTAIMDIGIFMRQSGTGGFFSYQPTSASYAIFKYPKYGGASTYSDNIAMVANLAGILPSVYAIPFSGIATSGNDTTATTIVQSFSVTGSGATSIYQTTSSFANSTSYATGTRSAAFQLNGTGTMRVRNQALLNYDSTIFRSNFNNFSSFDGVIPIATNIMRSESLSGRSFSYNALGAVVNNSSTTSIAYSVITNESMLSYPISFSYTDWERVFSVVSIYNLSGFPYLWGGIELASTS